MLHMFTRRDSLTSAADVRLSASSGREGKALGVPCRGTDVASCIVSV